MKTLCYIVLIFCTYQPMIARSQTHYKIIIQISENSIDKVDYALNSAQYLKSHYGHRIDILMIALNSAVKPFNVFSPIPIVTKIQDLKKQGVRFAMCRKAMQRYKLRPSDMRYEVDFVASGITEIIEKKQRGWLYIQL